VVVVLCLATTVVHAADKVCGVYASILSFDSPAVLDAAVRAEPSFLTDKHKQILTTQGDVVPRHTRQLKGAGFNTVFLTLYPIHGKDWWDISSAKALITDAVANAHAAGFRVHVGLSLFNGNFCDDPARYPGASRTIQCDGTRPPWVCFFDDRLWNYYAKNFTELAKLPDVDGLFLDPESYGPECYLCFCENCVRKYNAFAGQSMPTALVKPDSWLVARGLWKNYTTDWHAHEIRRHASALRESIHAINPDLQLSSLLWDYPVAVGANDARQSYFRQLAIGLGTKDKPSWTMPEHTYYSDAPDLRRIITQVYADIDAMGATGQVRVLPGVRLLRQPASTLPPRGQVIHDSPAVGYWLYELADFNGKPPIDFEGSLVDPEPAYLDALRATNAAITRPSGR
jgi:hypothetical protein